MIVFFEFVHAIDVVVAEEVHHDVELDLAVLKMTVALLDGGESFDLHYVLHGQLREVVLNTLRIVLSSHLDLLRNDLTLALAAVRRLLNARPKGNF